MLEYFNLLNQLQEGIIVKTDSDEGYNILFANNAAIAILTECQNKEEKSG